MLLYLHIQNIPLRVQNFINNKWENDNVETIPSEFLLNGSHSLAKCISYGPSGDKKYGSNKIMNGSEIRPTRPIQQDCQGEDAWSECDKNAMCPVLRKIYYKNF